MSLVPPLVCRDYQGAYGRQLWGALCLELWHQVYIDALKVKIILITDEGKAYG